MPFKLMLMLLIVAMIPRYVGALPFDDFEAEGEAISEFFNKRSPEDNVVWIPTGPTAEDIKAGHEEAAKLEGLVKKEHLSEDLRWAVFKGDLKDVQTLIAAGAEFEYEDFWGMTALMRAAQKGYTDIVKILISAGANIDAKDSSHGSTALLYAIENGHTEVAKLLIAKAKNSCNAQALASAVERHHLEIVTLLIANGAAKRSKIGFQDFSQKFGGWFLDALRFGDNEMAKALMPLAADQDRVSLQIASSFARKHCSVEIVNAVDDLLKKSNS